MAKELGFGVIWGWGRNVKGEVGDGTDSQEEGQHSLWNQTLPGATLPETFMKTPLSRSYYTHCSAGGLLAPYST